jgi:putative FmdB family regulatory protein
MPRAVPRHQVFGGARRRVNADPPPRWRITSRILVLSARSPRGASARATPFASSRRMPLYQYECSACGARFTEAMSIDDHDKRKPQCPQCKSQNIEQVIEAAYVKAARKT